MAVPTNSLVVASFPSYIYLSQWAIVAAVAVQTVVVMPNDAVFRWFLVSLGATVVAVGLYTQSLKKMAATYLVGILAIAGVFLPDWDFFDRDVSHWCSPISLHHSAAAAAAQPQTTPSRFKIYPIRMVVYTAVYGFAFYKWWMFISS